MSKWLTMQGQKTIRKSEVAALWKRRTIGECFAVCITLKSGVEVQWYSAYEVERECNEMYNYLLKELEIE